MFRTASSFKGYVVNASDGEAGALQQFLFDEETWTVRYLVVRTGKWFLNQRVLISPIAIRALLDDKKAICLHSRKSMIANSPLANLNRPVSRQYEEKYYAYYGWPVYWGQKNRWGTDLYPSALFTVAPLNEAASPLEEALRDTDLRSTWEMENFAVFGIDGKIGQVQDYILDDRSWQVRYLLVNAADAGAGTIVISPHWLTDMSIADKVLTADLTTGAVRGAPKFPGIAGLTRDYEVQLFSHYGCPELVDAVRVRQRVRV